jgi:hypothetical protein
VVVVEKWRGVKAQEDWVESGDVGVVKWDLALICGEGGCKVRLEREGGEKVEEGKNPQRRFNPLLPSNFYVRTTKRKVLTKYSSSYDQLARPEEEAELLRRKEPREQPILLLRLRLAKAQAALLVRLLMRESR